jgi:16S rRNA G1207 methylase RsmC
MDQKNKDTDHYFSSEPKSKERFGIVRATLCGRNFEFLTASSVFSKTKVDLGTRLLIESMVLNNSGMAFDIGCGYGVVGIVAAALNPKLHVVMSDVNVRAVRLARKNVEATRIRNAEVRHGCFYEPVEGVKFNTVLSNPPVSAGMDTVKSIVSQAPTVMADKATFQMVIRSKIGAKILPQLFCETFGGCTVLARGSGFRVLMGQRCDK